MSSNRSIKTEHHSRDYPQKDLSMSYYSYINYTPEPYKIPKSPNSKYSVKKEIDGDYLKEYRKSKLI